VSLLLVILVFVLLVALNAFFVFAEFASVRIRSSQIEEMLEKGVGRAKIAAHIHAHLDEYLSVCQVGITFASVALGFVGELVASKLIAPLFGGSQAGLGAHVVATTMSVVFVSFVHILVGEQVPKLIAIRDARRALLFTVRPLKVFHAIFILPLWLLNLSARAILRLLGLGAMSETEEVSEDELRILLERGQGSGLMSFRRLLFMENIFDLGEMHVRDAMRVKEEAVTLSPGMGRAEIEAVIGRRRYSRFPVVEVGADRPLGYVHVKDLGPQLPPGAPTPDLVALARPALTAPETMLLEHLLSTMQTKRTQFAIVEREGRWTGFITMEDILEEIVGMIGDEFEEDPPVLLAEALTANRIVLGVRGLTLVGAVREGLSRMRPADLPAPPEAILRAVAERERLASTYMGDGIAMPHARLREVTGPSLLLLRSEEGIRIEGSSESARFLFVLITPQAQPRVHQKLLQRVAELLESSEYVSERLTRATTPAEVYEIVVTGEQAAID